MKLSDILLLRRLREDKEIIIRTNGAEKKYKVWQLKENDILLNRHVINEFYDPQKDKYGVILK